MRQKNLRVVLTGVFLIVLAAGFFLYMLTLAPKSNDAAEMMRTVGMVSGAAGGLAVAMIIVGLIGRRT